MEGSTPPPVPPPLPGATTPPSNLPPRRSWWGRNWKWFVPLGCLTTIAAGFVFVIAIVAVVFGAMKQSEPYKVAMARAQADSRARQALGSSIHSGYFVTGSTNVSGGSGKADISIPVSGSKGSGTIYVVAEKSGGEWEYSKMELKVDKGDTIDLNSKEAKKETDSDDFR